MLQRALQVARAVWRRTTRLVRAPFGRWTRAPAAKPTLLRPGGAAPRRPGPVVARPPGAPVPPRPTAAPVAPSRSAPPAPVAPAPDPRLRALRRAAAFDLFRACGLGPPPRLLWRFVDGENAVGDGVSRFLRAAGDRGDGAALPDLLRAEARLARLAPDRADALAAELLSGDPARVAAAVGAAAAEDAPVLPWPVDFLPPEARDAWSGAPGAADPALRALLEEAAWTAGEHDRLRAAAAADWPDDRVDDAAGERLRELLASYEEAELRFFRALRAAGGAAGGALAEMTLANTEVAALVGSVRGGTAALASKPGADADADADELAPLEAALAAAPDRAAALAAWRAFRWRHHPDRPRIGDAERAARERRWMAADRLLDRLERSGRSGHAGGVGAA